MSMFNFSFCPPLIRHLKDNYFFRGTCCGLYEDSIRFIFKGSLRKRRGFSFLEITLALFFVTCMASGAMFVSSHIKGLGDVSAAKSRVSALGLKVREYYAIHDAFPVTLESLPDEIPDTFIDPWGKSYSYKANNGFFVIVSGGPDKAIETSLTEKFSKPVGDDIGICLKVE